MLKGKKLKDIVINEMSLVDKPANQRPFLLFKQEGKSQAGFLPVEKKKIKIEIESDGTKKGTAIKVNGDVITDMKSFNFSIWSESPDDASVSCSYSKLVESEGGFQRTESYYLAKGDNPMDDRIAKLLKKLFGDKEVKVEKSELNEATIVEIEKALTTINEYKEEYPTDLAAAIGLLAIHAGQGYKAPVEKKTDVKPAQTEREKKIKDAEDALAVLKGETSKTESSELQQIVETLAKSVADITGKLEKKEASEQLTKVTETLAEVSARLKAIEGQPASTKKSLSSSAGSTIKQQEVQKDSEGREIGQWPSLVGSPDADETGDEED